MGHADTLLAMGGAFLAAALLARLGGRIGLPTIPLFMLAGILLGPHTPGFVLVEDAHDFEMLSALGLVLLLFYLGLEFHLDDLKSGGRRLLSAGGIYLVLNVGAGLGFGFALGWGLREALVLAGVLGISSSAIVTKILIDTGRIGRPETRLILGVIVVEDIFLALYLAALQPVISGAQGLGETALQAGKAFGFLLVLAAAARFGTRLVGRLIATPDNELLVISFLGAAVLVAGVSEVLGVADAIGAFMVGLILAGTPSGPRIRELVHPLRDAFAAIFFFAFGLAIDPGDLASVAVPVAAAALLTLVMNVVAGLCVARVYRYGSEPAAEIATTLVARGEFALILAAMAASAGLDARLAPFIAGYVLVLAVLGPIVAGRAPVLAAGLRAVAGRLPGRRTPPPADPSAGPEGDAGEPVAAPLPAEAER
ncbi:MULTISPECIES: cation:proton antiporter [Streptomyces]|jgi:CPA2 family monovalent cation:H+ antiporter-2|uniref:CPA2 family monovalent cation:H+ antiporter-2 n=2 Tax=Streptomyces TaxID=1883 RepID=A0ABT9L878_STRGD|nr:MULTISPECIES: cation:proton antiporter [Streptomyces]MDP9679864.1 CPA2 family monovalent cation:H+ antiporter-2 [Streptomyces griseoviridis]GGT24589.1 transporter [Streptomyces griseoviridis]GGU58557.1 transporter [Streptomyces daghestanicus]GHI30139.1 transporter [Streptomyces daghestanicus]